MVLEAIETSFETSIFTLNIKNKPAEDNGINYKELITKEQNKLKRAKEAYETGVYDLSEFSASKKAIGDVILKNFLWCSGT